LNHDELVGVRCTCQRGPLQMSGVYACVVVPDEMDVEIARDSGLDLIAPIVFADDPGEKAIGSLGVGPILANQKNALPHGAPDLSQQFAESIAKSRIAKFASSGFAINPALRGRGSLRSQPRHSMPQYETSRLRRRFPRGNITWANARGELMERKRKLIHLHLSPVTARTNVGAGA
jgi:hypothetical protein